MNQAKLYLDSLSYDEQTKLLLNLTKYARSTAKGKFWRSGNKTELSDAETAPSVVSLAFEKVLTEDEKGRNWNPQKMPDFLKYMQGVIRSLLYHMATGEDNNIFVNENNSRYVGSMENESVGVLAVSEEKFIAAKATREFEDKEWLVRKQLSPEDELIDAEKKAFYDQVLEEIYKISAKDPEVSEMLRAMDYNYVESRKIAEFMKTDVDKIYKARKRLNTIVTNVKQKFDL
jgi:hypothetical protein